MPYRRGRKSAAQTPAPRSERIKGSKKNPKGTAASKSSAAKIVLSDKTINALSKKVKEYNDKHKNSVSLNTLKAVYRRGLGAYSSSHRPTITGGVPNTRNAWAMARVNKFLMKKAGKKVKAAYVQDDDLLEKGGNVYDDKTLLKKFKQGKSIGFSAEAHLKAKGLLPRVDGTKRKSEKYAEGGLIAPNGKPSNLTPEQYKLVRTPEFKAWFGDWENDPENASKVVDDNGEPLVVYHGTSASFNTFKEEEKGRRGGLNEKFWSFTTNIEQAKIYALDNRVYGSFSTPRIIPAFLNIREMPSYDNQGKFYKELEVWGGYKHIDIFQLQDWHSRGFNMGVEFKEVDGFEVKNTIEMEERADLDKTLLIGNTYYVRNSNQIKLADGTNTTFDANNPDIRFAKGGFNDDKLHKDLQEFLDLEFYSATKYSDVSKSCDLAKGNCYDISEELMAFLKSKGYKNMSLVEVRNPLFDLSDAHYEWVDMPKDKLFHIILKVDDKFIDLTGIQYSKNQEGLKVYTQDEIDTLWGKIEYFEKGGFDDEIIICSNCLWSWKLSETTPEEKYICHKCGHDNTPKTMDKITMDVPLFIRLLEFAREDAKDDMELHTMTENAVSMGDKMLTMEDYDKIVFSKITSSKITKPNKSVVDFPTIEEEFADGGVVVGKRHSESDENGTGEKFLVQSTGQLVELEGGEGVLCKESMQSKKIYKFEGKEMTGREIASYLNHKYGGVEFAKGGEVDDKSVCGCRSMYYHGGELPSATLDSLKGGEAVVTVKTMESKDKFSFQGRQMTPRKILSHINQDSGGKKFEEGGIIDLTEHHLKNLSKMAKMVSFTEKIFYF